MAEQLFYMARDSAGENSNYILANKRLHNITTKDGTASWDTNDPPQCIRSPVEVCAEYFEAIAETPEGDPYVLPRGAGPRKVKFRLIVEELGRRSETSKRQNV